MGPKISKPFEAAKASLSTKKNAFELSRDKYGAVEVKLTEDAPLAATVALHARVKGTAPYAEKSVKVGTPLSMPYKPTLEVEAFAEAKDAQGGPVYAAGSEKAPRLLPARTVAAVASAADEARRQADGSPAEEVDESADDQGFRHWPLVVGIVAVAGAGVAVGVIAANQPPALTLPPADRTGRLP
jgi:hypothetical protein